MILGVLALKALKRRPKFTTKYVVNGIAHLVKNAINDTTDRYFGYNNYHVLTEDTIFVIPIYQSTQDLLEIPLAECWFAAPNQEIDGKYYFFSSEQEHGVTLAHALIDLEELAMRN